MDWSLFGCARKGHVTYAPDEPELRDRLMAPTAGGTAWRCLRCGTFVTHGQHGPRIMFTDDPAGEWEQADGPAFPEDTGVAVERTWIIQPGEEDGVLWAGVAPAAAATGWTGTCRRRRTHPPAG